VIALDPLGNVLGRGMRNLVPEHRREPGVILGQRQDPRVDDDLPAWQAEGVRLVFLDQAHPPDEVRLVAARNGLDAPRDPLHFGVLRPRRDDPRAVLTQRLGVLLSTELHLLRVSEGDVLDTVRDRRLLAVGVKQHDPDDRRGEGDCDQRAADEEADDCFRAAVHERDTPSGSATANQLLVRSA
jgi:hypothetical protein